MRGLLPYPAAGRPSASIGTKTHILPRPAAHRRTTPRHATPYSVELKALAPLAHGEQQLLPENLGRRVRRQYELVEAHVRLREVERLEVLPDLQARRTLPSVLLQVRSLMQVIRSARRRRSRGAPPRSMASSTARARSAAGRPTDLDREGVLEGLEASERGALVARHKLQDLGAEVVAELPHERPEPEHLRVRAPGVVQRAVARLPQLLHILRPVRTAQTSVQAHRPGPARRAAPVEGRGAGAGARGRGGAPPR